MDYSKLGEKAGSNQNLTREIDNSTVLIYDADFACYEVSDLEKTARENFENLIDMINMKRCIAGATRVYACITLGKKSGREQMATIKPYQENRDPDAPIKVRVRELRHLLANYAAERIKVRVGLFYEADDIMCRLQNTLNSKGFKSILMSGDKDLWMVQGWHCDAKTGRMWKVDGYGKTEYREVGNVKPKLIGEGYSWFWHQMIMGDKVDNIPGLPKIANSTLDIYLPLKSNKPRVFGTSACGEAKAVAMLEGVTDCKTAAIRVYDAYWQVYGGDAMTRFIEQAYLLWMQRTSNLWDVLVYMKDCGLRLEPSIKQLKIIQAYEDEILNSSK